MLGAAALLPSSADDKNADAPPKFTAEQVATFEKDVLPVLKEHCFKCHGAEAKIKGGLNLNNRKAILDGGDSGAVFDEKNPEKSLLLTAVHYKDEQYRMPPKGKLPGAKRPLHDLDRRDFIMLAAGVGGTVAAILSAMGLARLVR